MKKINFIIAFIVLFSSNSCFSQKLVQKENDIQKIEDNKARFIGKPLKNLLQEIKPPIKRVMARPSVNIYSYVGNFIFNFVDSKQKDSLRSKDKIPVTLVVFVKENFDWDFQKRPKGKETIWTSEDVKKYENLTIVGFRIYGDATAPN